jgi:hypothetical protein
LQEDSKERRLTWPLQLRDITTVVADIGDIEAIEAAKPQDATTNPSLIAAAAQLPQYRPIVDAVLINARKQLSESASNKDVANFAFKRLAIAFGKKILAIIPGRVSTEVDTRLSHDTDAAIKLAQEIIHLYDHEGISRERVLVKIASTWEGIRASGAFLIGTRTKLKGTIRGRTIPACSQSPRSTATSRSLDTKLWSWEQASATKVRFLSWPATIS